MKTCSDQVKKYQIVGKFFPEGRSLSFESRKFKTNPADVFKLKFLMHEMGGVWIWVSPV